MRAVIQPREKYEKDGYAMMPLLKAVMAQGGVTALCTACALRRR